MHILSNYTIRFDLNHVCIKYWSRCLLVKDEWGVKSKSIQSVFIKHFLKTTSVYQVLYRHRIIQISMIQPKTIKEKTMKQ